MQISEHIMCYSLYYTFCQVGDSFAFITLLNILKVFLLKRGRRRLERRCSTKTIKESWLFFENSICQSQESETFIHFMSKLEVHDLCQEGKTEILYTYIHTCMPVLQSEDILNIEKWSHRCRSCLSFRRPQQSVFQCYF